MRKLKCITEKELDEAAQILLTKDLIMSLSNEVQKVLLYNYKGKEEIPSYAITKFVDPTRARDTVPGAAIGYIAKKGEYSYETLVKAMYYGSAAASITVEGFGTESIMNTNIDDVNERFKKLIGGPGRL